MIHTSHSRRFEIIDKYLFGSNAAISFSGGINQAMGTLQHKAEYIVDAIVIYILCHGFGRSFKGVPIPCSVFILGPRILQSRIIKHFLVKVNCCGGTQAGRDCVLLSADVISFQNRLHLRENAVAKIDIVVHRLNQVLGQIREKVNGTAIEHHVRGSIACYRSCQLAGNLIIRHCDHFNGPAVLFLKQRFNLGGQVGGIGHNLDNLIR